MSLCVKIIKVYNGILFNIVLNFLFKEQLITNGTVFIEPPGITCKQADRRRMMTH